MRRFVLLCEELEVRPGDDDRVAALSRWFAEAGRDAALGAIDWLLPAEPGRRAARPARLALHRLHAAARDVAVQAGTPGWLFDAGTQACRDPAEAIALNLPEADAAGAASAGAREPTLAQWLQSWRAAAALETTDERAHAVVRSIARLEDSRSRRWAVRAVAALARPIVTPWQWMRAWAAAFDEDFVALAWRWHVGGRLRALVGQPDLLAAVPRPRSFVPHERLADGPPGDTSAIANGLEGRRPEPHWRGLRVQVVRSGDAVALWHHEGELLNARLASLLHAVAWPEPSAIEAVLIGWQGGHVVSPWTAQRSAAWREAGRDVDIDAPSLHLVLTDWHRWEADEASARTLAERRGRLREQWPEFEARWLDGVPPPVFVTPSGGSVAEDADVLRRIASGVLLRQTGPGGADPRERRASVWHVPAARRCVRLVLQYVPSEALSPEGVAALAVLPCGFAIWSRQPHDARERTAGLLHSQSPLTQPDPATLPAGGSTAPAARLLPLVRAPMALPAPTLARVHAWVRGQAGPRFGAMNTVLPALVFELSFDVARASPRHRAGVALEGARVERWIEDAVAGQADDGTALGGALPA